MKRILFITGDFDEGELRTEYYDDVDHMVRDRSGWNSFKEMKDYVEEHGLDDDECEGCEKMLLELVEDGYHIDEWHSYHVYYGDMAMGVGNV
ncbi:hypothetical protein BRC2024_KCUCJSVR_CDS_0080 [Acinetobacter phage vB_AbaM_KissB]|uniref:hypothetical protein n=1 Tax=Acinetobacter phage vB_AbaM_phiAbaA1 TaxID=1605379 RepID=UPI00078C9533|nr:hypothetical protein BJD49_gp085 [Acinetobacter phage vB_AbaM_phiAbaA1]AJK27205.1 hypothetical protein phiAbaA1_102 [Acinetobacter phage vB_AbaM_phiAbaA1]